MGLFLFAISKHSPIWGQINKISGKSFTFIGDGNILGNINYQGCYKIRDTERFFTRVLLTPKDSRKLLICPYRQLKAENTFALGFNIAPLLLLRENRKSNNNYDSR